MDVCRSRFWERIPCGLLYLLFRSILASFDRDGGGRVGYVRLPWVALGTVTREVLCGLCMCSANAACVLCACVEACLCCPTACALCKVHVWWPRSARTLTALWHELMLCLSSQERVPM